MTLHQYVDAAIGVDGRLDDGPAGVAVGEVGALGDHLAAGCADFVGHGFQSAGAARADRKLRTVLGELQRDLAAQSRPDAGDDGDFPLEQHQPLSQFPCAGALDLRRGPAPRRQCVAG
jgi:hypothetical protein